MAEKLAPNFMDSEFKCRCCGKLPRKGDENTSHCVTAAIAG
jgi:hypothetical protein